MNIANMGKVKRNITAEDLAASSEFKRRWTKLKTDDPKISQGEAATKMGFSQSMFNQLLHGTVTWAPKHVKAVGDYFKAPYSAFKTFTDLPYEIEDLPAAKQILAKEPTDEEKAIAEFRKQLLFFFEEISTDNKDALVLIANKLHDIEKGIGTSSNPYGRRRTDKKVAKQKT